MSGQQSEVIVFYTFMMVNEKSMRIKQDLEHTASLRSKASAGGKGASLALERDRENIIGGSKKMF